MGNERYEVVGMTCGGCARSLRSALEGAGFEPEACDINVLEGTVTVDEGQPLERLDAAVTKAGFHLGAKLS